MTKAIVVRKIQGTETGEPGHRQRKGESLTGQDDAEALRPRFTNKELRQTSLSLCEPGRAPIPSAGMIRMQVISQPAAKCGRRVLLRPPLRVHLHLQDGGADGSVPSVDLSTIWAVASLTDASGTTTLAPPRQNLLTGVLVDSVHSSLEADDAAGGATTAAADADGFVQFANLAILETGRYRIRVTLIKMQSSASSAAATAQAGSSLQSIESDIIEIDDRPANE